VLLSHNLVLNREKTIHGGMSKDNDIIKFGLSHLTCKDAIFRLNNQDITGMNVIII